MPKPVVFSPKTYLDAALSTENIAAVFTPKARPLPSLPSATEPKQQATILAAYNSPPAEVNLDLSTAEVHQERKKEIPPKKAAAATACSI